MSHISLVVGVFVLASAVWQQPPPVAAQDSGRLRWVRGSVTEVSPASLTVQLRDKTLTLTLDRDTRLVRPTADAAATPVNVGSLVEVHYVDNKPVKRAVLILSGTLGTAKAPRRAGYSYQGVISRMKKSSAYLKVDAKTREVHFDQKTTLTGESGDALAIGRKAVAPQLSVGQAVLVTYNEQSDGDQSYQLALEVRKLGS